MLVAPYLAFPGWEGIYEANANKERARAARMVHHQEIFETQQCSEFEAMLYISSATLAQPVSHDWANIYMHLFQRWDPEAAAKLQIEPDRPELNENQKDDLAGLRRWIFNQQIAHMRRRGRGAIPLGDVASNKVEPELVQLSFFDQDGGEG